jgi:hypothetical protein
VAKGCALDFRLTNDGALERLVITRVGEDAEIFEVGLQCAKHLIVRNKVDDERI